jgi:anti-sigma factor RsiW
MIDEQLEFRISQYADGTLPAAEVAALEATLGSDADARALLEEYRKLDVVLKRETPALPEIKWERLAEHISGAVADEDRATTTYKISARTSTWWVRSVAVAAAVVIAFGTVVLWPRGKQGEVATTTPNQPVAVALIEVGGPQVASKPPVEEISVEPSALADAENFRISEDIVYRPSRVVIASGDSDRQDSGRLPY